MKYPNILWITIDACRKDMLYSLPYIKKISEKSIVFENAFANAPWTLPSVSSMFTGLYPSQHGALNEKTKLKKNVKTIAEVLSEKGYDTAIITQNDGWITPYYGLTRGFRKVYDIEKMMGETLKIKLPKSKKMKMLIRFFAKYFIGYDVLTKKLLKSIVEAEKEPWFIYLHLMDTHMPYEPRTLPVISIVRYLVFYKNWKEKMQRTWVGEKSFTERELRMLKRLYQKSVEYVGKQIQEYTKLLDNKTVLIITADHGENLGENGMVGHEFSFSEPLISVPLIIYSSFIKRNKIDFLFETKNIFYILEEFSIGNANGNIIKSDYIFGENEEIEAVIKKLKNIKNDFLYPKKFLRTKHVKYIKYTNGTEEVYMVSNNMEDKLVNHELIKNLRSLSLIKETRLNKLKLNKIKTI